MERRGLVQCAVAAVLFGVSTPAASRLADDMSAFTLAGLLYVGAALACAPVAARRPWRGVGRRAIVLLSVAVVAGGAVAPVLLAAGLQDVPASTASLLLNAELGFTVLLAAAVFGEHLGRRVLAGTVLVLAAGVVLAWSGDADLRWGAVFVVAACAAWSLDSNLAANLPVLSPAQITFVKGAGAGPVNLVLGLAVAGGGLGAADAAWALLIGAVGYGASITLWVSGARRMGAARAQLVFATALFVGAVVAWTVFDEAVLGREVTAAVLALAGVALVLKSTHDHEHRHDDRVHAHPHMPDLEHRHHGRRTAS